MKALLFVISSMYISTHILSQFNVPFATDNAIWTTRKITQDPITFGAVYSYGHACLDGSDTIIGMNTYTQISRCNYGAYLGAMRENNFKVYYMAPDSTNEYLLYDFDVSVGQILNNVIYMNGYDLYNTLYPELMDLTVTAIDTVNYDGMDRWRVFVAPNGSSEGSSWIQGIGNTKGILFENYINVGGYGLQLLCYSEDNGQIYPTSDPNPCDITLHIDEILIGTSVEIYPNPAKEAVNISAIETFSSIETWNALGQQIINHEFSNTTNYDLILPQEAGIYYIKVNFDKSTMIRKIVRM